MSAAVAASPLVSSSPPLFLSQPFFFVAFFEETAAATAQAQAQAEATQPTPGSFFGERRVSLSCLLAGGRHGPAGGLGPPASPRACLGGRLPSSETGGPRGRSAAGDRGAAEEGAPSPLLLKRSSPPHSERPPLLGAGPLCGVPAPALSLSRRSRRSRSSSACASNVRRELQADVAVAEDAFSLSLTLTLTLTLTLSLSLSLSPAD